MYYQPAEQRAFRQRHKAASEKQSGPDQKRFEPAEFRPIPQVHFDDEDERDAVDTTEPRAPRPWQEAAAPRRLGLLHCNEEQADTENQQEPGRPQDRPAAASLQKEQDPEPQTMLRAAALAA